MNRQVLVVISVVAVVCLTLGNVHAEKGPEKNAYSETTAVVEPAGVEVDPTRAITAYDYRAMMLRSVGKIFQCWRCSSPCSAYACCNDGYPQCCLVNGLYCMCCRA